MDMTAALCVSAIGVVYPIITRTMLNTLIPERNYRMVVILGLTLLFIITYVSVGIKITVACSTCICKQAKTVSKKMLQTHACILHPRNTVP